MKTTNIIASALLVLMLVFATATYALAEEGSDDSISDVFIDASADGSIIADSISSTDISVSEVEIDEIGEEFAKRTITRGNGWIVTNGKGGLLEVQFISGYASDQVISKGWIKTGDLKFKIESTSETADTKEFRITAKDGSVKGTLTLEKANSYQTGFGIWKGQIELTVGTEAFKAEVNMALEEKVIGKGKKIEDRVKSVYSGGMELGGISYTLEGRSSSSDKIELVISASSGESEMEGKLILESVGNNNYEGEIKIEEVGDYDRLSGKVTATLTKEGNTLYGPIKVQSDESSSAGATTAEGTIKLALSERISSSSDDSKDSSRDEKSIREKEDKSGSSGSETKKDDNSGSSDRGFWKKFFSIFTKEQ